MMKRIVMLMMIVSLGLTACDKSEVNDSKQSNQQGISENEKEKESIGQKRSEEMIDLQILVGEKEFSAKFYNNETTQALVEEFPLTVTMNDLNKNEKYYQFSKNFPTDVEQPREIHNGDIMLYQNDYLVLFYETFSTSYSYTRLGYMEDVEGLAQALGKGNVQITFQVTKK